MGLPPREQKPIWGYPPNERVTVHKGHFLVFGLLIFFGSLLGAFSSVSFPLAWGVNFFWLGIVVQQVGAIWFGMWGVLAGVIFPFFSNKAAGAPFLVSLAYLPANFIQGFLPAWAFRHYEASPRLAHHRDYVVLVLSILVADALGALWAPFIALRRLHLVNPETVSLFVLGWFGGNLTAGLVFNILILRVLSPLVMRSAVFVRRWWV